MDGRRKFPLEIAWEQAGRELEEELRQRADPHRSGRNAVSNELVDGPQSVRGHHLSMGGGLEIVSDDGTPDF